MTHLIQVLFRAMLGFFAGVAFYFAFLLLWWEFAPYQTAEIIEPIVVLNENKEVGSDRQLQLMFGFTKYTDITPKVSRNVICVDDTVHFVIGNQTSGVARPVGTFTARPVYTLDDSVPTDTECYFTFTNEYKVNPIRSETKVWVSEPFKVVE